MKNEMDIKSWQWIFYIIGWISGAFNIIFWAVLVVLFFGVDKERGETKFFNKNLHDRVFYWGCIVFIIVWISFVGMFFS